MRGGEGAQGGRVRGEKKKMLNLSSGDKSLGNIDSEVEWIWCVRRGGGLGSRPKKMYGERLGDGVEYHLMSPTPRR